MRPTVDLLVFAEEGKDDDGSEEEEEDELDEPSEPRFWDYTMKLSSKPIDLVLFSLKVVFWKWLSSTDSTC